MECTSNCSLAGECSIEHRSCNLCPRGTFSNVVGAGECAQCRNGTVAPNPGQLSCSDTCPMGTTNNDLWTKCVDCAPGSANPLNASVCALCDVGYYSGARALACLPCPRGMHSSARGAAACLPCGPGFYASNIAATACFTCTSGYYCAGDASEIPVPCDADHYCPAGAAQQLPCPVLYGAEPMRDHCVPTSAFYGMIAVCVLAVVIVMLVLAVRAVRKREQTTFETTPLVKGDLSSSASLAAAAAASASSASSSLATTSGSFRPAETPSKYGSTSNVAANKSLVYAGF
jgi:hypothetical protein